MNETLIQIFRFLHFIGLAALVGGLLVQIKQPLKQVNIAVIIGAFAQLVTGMILLFLTLSTANHIKVSVKIIVLLFIFIPILIYRKKAVPATLFISMLVLSLLNIGLAVFW
jgi:hypothetical protein